MKKLFVAVALVMGMSTLVANATEMATVSSVMVMSGDGQPIELSDLPEAVVNSIATIFGELTAKSAMIEVNAEGEEFYVIVFTDNEGNFLDVSFDEFGKIIG